MKVAVLRICMRAVQHKYLRPYTADNRQQPIVCNCQGALCLELVMHHPTLLRLSHKGAELWRLSHSFLPTHLRTASLVRKTLSNREGHEDRLRIPSDRHSHRCRHRSPRRDRQLLHVHKRAVGVAPIDVHDGAVAFSCWGFDSLHSIHNNHSGAISAQRHLCAAQLRGKQGGVVCVRFVAIA